MIDDQSKNNQAVSSDFMRVLLALKDNVMRNLHCAELGIVKKIDSTIQCELVNAPNININCVKLKSVELKQNDIVLIIYTDSNFTENLKRFKNHKNRENTINDMHSQQNGVVIGVIE